MIALSERVKADQMSVLSIAVWLSGSEAEQGFCDGSPCNEITMYLRPYGSSKFFLQRDVDGEVHLPTR